MIVEPCIYTEPEDLPGTVEFSRDSEEGHTSTETTDRGQTAEEDRSLIPV